MANPLVDQGQLNRIRANVTFTNFPQLNITASFLTKAGVSLRLTGETVPYLETMTGQVPSPNVYLPAECEVHIVKSSALSNLFKLQVEQQALIGPFTVTPDTSALGVYPILNGSLSAPSDLNLAGESADYTIMLKGFYPVNATLFG